MATHQAPRRNRRWSPPCVGYSPYPCGQLIVIEVNFSGYHPVCGEGFQCSGYYQDVEWGASMIARLLRFVEDTDGVSIDLDIDLKNSSREGDFYAEVIRWREMLRNGEYE